MLDDFPEWEPCHRAILSKGIYGFENVGGDLDKVTGKRVTFAAFPWRWVGGDGCIVRLVAIVDPTGSYRIETWCLMNVTRVSGAPAYLAPLHHGVSMVRLQGHEAGPSERFWVGLSTYQPGGVAEIAAAPRGDRLCRPRRRAGHHRRGNRNGLKSVRQRAFRQGRGAVDRKPF